MALSDTTIPRQSRPGNDGHEGVLHIPQRLFGGYYPYTEMQSV